MPAHVNRKDVDQWEHKHPDEIDKVPVQTANLDILMLELFHSGSYYTQVDGAGRNVKHMQTGDREKRCAEQRRRRRAVGKCEYLYPVLGQEERPQAFTNKVIPLDQVQHDEGYAEEDRCEDPFSGRSFLSAA